MNKLDLNLPVFAIMHFVKKEGISLKAIKLSSNLITWKKSMSEKQNVILNCKFEATFLKKRRHNN